MPKSPNVLRDRLMLVSFLAFVIVTVFMATANPGISNVYTFAPEIVKQRDVIALLIKPVGSSLSAVVREIKGSGHDLSVTTNQTTNLLPEYISPPYSFIQMLPYGDLYNFTVTFYSNSPTSVHFGVITTSPENYPGRQVYRLANVFFVRFSSISGLPPGNITLQFQFSVDKSSASSGWLPEIVLPPFANLLAFLAIAVAITYVETFALVVSFFRNRSGTLSNYWKIGIVLSILLSAYILYWAYSNLLTKTML